MKTSTAVMTAGALVMLALMTSAQASDARVLERDGWFAGLPVNIKVQIPKAHGGTGPNAPTDEHPDVIVYVTGATRAEGSSVAEMSVPTPHGPRVLPAHDDVIARMVPATAPADAIAWFVVPGPKADDSTVRSQPDPAGSWPGAPLAREIFVGATWVKLTNHAVIEYGLAMGWLALKYFDYGGLATSAYPDQNVRLGVKIAIDPSPALPEAE